MAPITDTYWPTFKQAVEDNHEGDSSVELTCGICLETMDIRHPVNFPDHPADHLARILPCGHIIGSTCLYQMLEGIKTDYYQCPTCKTKFHDHPKCGHPMRGQLLPAEASEYSKVPPILSAGGRIPANCAHCESDCLTKELGSYRNIYGTNELANELAIGDDECLAFYLLAVGYRDPDKLAKSNGMDHKIRHVDPPEDMLAVWKIYHQSLAPKASMFWYEYDLTTLSYEGGVFKRKTPSQPRKRSLFLRIFNPGH
ncbi:hypothetical protein NW762_011988 [Fusarium torreyae]|uniref:RING-type domain-containing protein n=1 Tax=Fusarium torreyae TaxID=1237075 RepID=A0A9W8RQX0_9HYPO|nr:hypothetical protein NW762_011988 [Fusarium torreyae]